jgi:hypothetical protein
VVGGRSPHFNSTCSGCNASINPFNIRPTSATRFAIGSTSRCDAKPSRHARSSWTSTSPCEPRAMSRWLRSARCRLRRFPSPMFEGIETAARLSCAVSPKRSSAGNRFRQFGDVLDERHCVAPYLQTSERAVVCHATGACMSHASGIPRICEESPENYDEIAVSKPSR